MFFFLPQSFAAGTSPFGWHTFRTSTHLFDINVLETQSQPARSTTNSRTGHRYSTAQDPHMPRAEPKQQPRHRRYTIKVR